MKSEEQQYDEQSVDRRRFLKGIAVTAVAATATGVGAAHLSKQDDVPAVIATVPAVSSQPFSQPIIPPITANNNSQELWSMLADSQAENIRLQAALNSANSQVSGLQQQLSGGSQTNDQLTVELATASEQASLLAGLVALYEQLDEVDLPTVLDDGLTAVSDTITNWVDDIPTLDEGLLLAKESLDDLEAHIPLLENGRIWLDSQANKLHFYYQAIEILLQTAVETIGPFLEMANEWFEKVRRWLPFNMGEQAAEIMQSITILVTETPHTVSGLDTNVAQPLDVWLRRDEGDTPLQNNVVKPIREKVIDKATIAIVKAQGLQTVYQTQLEDPAQTAAASQRLIKDLIAQYRERHQI